MFCLFGDQSLSRGKILAQLGPALVTGAMILLVLAGGVLLGLGGVLGVLYWRFLRNKSFWRNKGVPCKKPRFLVGQFGEAGSKNLGLIFRELYEEAWRRGEKMLGVWQFTIPVLLVVDPELAKKMLVTDFPHFDDHGVYFDERTDPIAANLLTVGGERWRRLRSKLNPALTGSKVRSMFPLMLACGEELAATLASPAETNQVLEFKDLLARYTTDVISSCAFGIESHSLADENAVFRVMGKKVFQSSWEVLWRNFVGFLFPDFAKFFRIRIYPKELNDFFVGVIRETMNYRESNHVKRNDILQMLMELKNKGYIGEEHPNAQNHLINEGEEARGKGESFGCEQAAAQAFIFFTAGFETSSTTMQYALYEMALEPSIQDKARLEVQRVLSRHDGVLSYDALREMTYLARVLSETLRKYPPVTNISRVCTKDYKIPGTDVVLDKGTQISVSILGIHRDERYYPDPLRFDPDRFADERHSSRPPFTYIPFGDGPRVCIGQKFGVTQIKIGLVCILSKYRVSICEEKSKVPPVYDPKSFFSAPLGGMFLKISLLDNESDTQKLVD